MPADLSSGPVPHRLLPLGPTEVRISGVRPVPLTIHQDSRGFLVETLRTDDARAEGSRFKMSYTSLTIPGQFRDADRWHVHQLQTDRFVVLLGEMTLALCDQRKGSATEGNLEVVRLSGIPFSEPAHPSPRDLTTYLLPVPPGVLHALGNLSSTPFLYQNFPTELYNPTDEGRVPFPDLNVPSLRGPFSWTLIQRRAAP